MERGTTLMSGGNSAASRVMIPELLHNILFHLDESHRKRLMTVCRLFFNCSAPRIWRDPLLKKLFALVPGVVITTEWESENPNDIDGLFIVVDIPDYADFTRLELYAGYVRSVFLGGERYQFRNKEALVTYCNARKGILLPNIEKLALGYHPLWNLHPMIDWLNWILGPALLYLVLYPAGCYSGTHNWNDGIVVGLQQILPERCPNVQEVHIGAAPSSSSLDETPFLHESLSSLPRLRAVTGNGSLLEPQNLEMLSALPWLETLEVHTGYDVNLINIAKTSWPPTPFPSIRSLKLKYMGYGEMKSVFSIPCLVNSLTSVIIEMHSNRSPPPFDSDTDDELETNLPDPDEWSRAFIQNLPARSRYLSTLTLSLATHDHVVWLSPAELKALGQLPLERIDFFGIGFSNVITGLDLVLAMPRVQTLRLRSMKVRLEDLQPYATHLSGLKVLRFSEILLGADFPVGKNPVSSVEHRVVIEDSGIRAFVGEDVLLCARGLGKLWPNVCCVTTEWSPSEQSLSTLSHLNNAIKQYHGQDKAGPR